MPPLRLPACPFLGPTARDKAWTPRLLPADYATEPFKYLPPKIVLSDAELGLAAAPALDDAKASKGKDKTKTKDAGTTGGGQ